jgi:hypothetical protein
MDRRAFIEAAVVGLATAGVAQPKEGRFCSIKNGIRGRCFVDGHEVRAVVWWAGPDGHALVPSPEGADYVLLHGHVRFEPFGDAA